MRRQHRSMGNGGLNTKNGRGARNIDGRNQDWRGLLPRLDLPSLTGRYRWKTAYTARLRCQGERKH